MIEDMAEAQAIGLCWLARQKGLPEINSLRVAVATLHPENGCGWCDYPLPELVRMIGTVSPRAEREWWAMPGKARLRALQLAQGEEAAS